ncbi:hypothetical protein WN51_13359 [Melipona quadrifasciata]|uniref:Uncharacterized protein n=1 Tax=Melipona quadrifasciata TaxID=166423 RepID=A0A0N0U5S9_9HYME|nr:hypothetical protein WN51_13359 [Melipona quadrifasciata]
MKTKHSFSNVLTNIKNIKNIHSENSKFRLKCERHKGLEWECPEKDTDIETTELKMKQLFLLLAYVCLTQCALAKKQTRDQQATGYEYEYVQEPVLSEPLLASVPLAYGREPSQPGFSVGGPLASIAKGAAAQAHTQLSNQESAAGQAAYVAKNTLAQAAAQSAATAAAALAGKQIVVQGLEQQLRDAHVTVDGEKLQLQQAERAANAARTTAKQAIHQLQVATAALNAAQATVDRAAQAAAEAAAELAAQTTMLGQAKAKAESVDEQLSAARLDYETTQTAAEKAATAAAAAQNNAAAAAAHVADTAVTSALLTHEPVSPSPLPKLPSQHSAPREPSVLEPAAYQEPSALLLSGALHQSAALRPSATLLRIPSRFHEAAALHEADDLRIPTAPQDAVALRVSGLLRETDPALQSPNGLHRSELLSLANALPSDNYDIKSYRY